MPTIFNPYSKHEWFYNGPVPNKLEHEIALTYFKTERRNTNGISEKSKRIC